MVLLFSNNVAQASGFSPVKGALGNWVAMLCPSVETSDLGRIREGEHSKNPNRAISRIRGLISDHVSYQVFGTTLY
jgi:hypothetical protein